MNNQQDKEKPQTFVTSVSAITNNHHHNHNHNITSVSAITNNHNHLHNHNSVQVFNVPPLHCCRPRRRHRRINFEAVSFMAALVLFSNPTIPVSLPVNK